MASAHFDRRGGILIALLIAASAVLLSACHRRLPPTRRPILPRPRRLPPPIRPLYPIRHLSLSRVLLRPRRHRALRRRRARRKSSTQTSGSVASSSTQPDATPANRKHRKGLTVLMMSRIGGCSAGRVEVAASPKRRICGRGDAACRRFRGGGRPGDAYRRLQFLVRALPAGGVLAAALATLLLAATPSYALDASRVLRPVGELALRACHDRHQHPGRYRRRKGASHMTGRLALGGCACARSVAPHHGKRGR